MVPYTSKSFFFSSEKFWETTLVILTSSGCSFLDFGKESPLCKNPQHLAPNYIQCFNIYCCEIQRMCSCLYISVFIPITSHFLFPGSWRIICTCLASEELLSLFIRSLHLPYICLYKLSVMETQRDGQQGNCYLAVSQSVSIRSSLLLEHWVQISIKRFQQIHK